MIAGTCARYLHLSPDTVTRRLRTLVCARLVETKRIRRDLYVRTLNFTQVGSRLSADQLDGALPEPDHRATTTVDGSGAAEQSGEHQHAAAQTAPAPARPCT
ncbi:hypothetical protein [Nonomuraea endophytica]|uniref:Uncharacterized protein n=1 Tax=Nonomuraea endophytica TaxID=714136 RepID=A0A7W8EL67_9ACTN|nr:hypothetical protein [Nonomuraea endophytica]MBB5083559.1 hypothetical protein [Nonomuraea endophytica]